MNNVSYINDIKIIKSTAHSLYEIEHVQTIFWINVNIKMIIAQDLFIRQFHSNSEMRYFQIPR